MIGLAVRPHLSDSDSEPHHGAMRQMGVSDSPHLQATYWASFSKYLFQQTSFNGLRYRSSMLSVVLDEGIWARFSGIEILIIFKEGLSEDVVRLSYLGTSLN